MVLDPIKLTQDLIRCESVTPIDDGALDVLSATLSAAGFVCTRIDRGNTVNLFARWGQGKTLGFNGHTDVVPIGDAGDWTYPAFGAEIHDGIMFGRGATDMKSGVAAFVAAAIDFVISTPPDGSVVVTITGDEEGPATDGTTAILDWMQANDEHIDHCLVGEPTCPNEMGEMIKIGRRGSMTAYFTANGVQGHAAYPDRACNPIPALARLVDRLSQHQLDTGTEHFDPSTIAVTGFDVGNEATNVIPAQARAMANIRFNDAHQSADLTTWLRAECDKIESEFDVKIAMDVKVSGESFITEPDAFTTLVTDAVEAETGRVPVLSTSGGTSDARFIKSHCPVVEVGLVGKTMHQVDEQVPVAQITQLKAIYQRILAAYFA